MKLAEKTVVLAMTSRIRGNHRQGNTISSKLMADYLVKYAKEARVIDQPIRSDPDIRPVLNLENRLWLPRRWRGPTKKRLPLMALDVLAVWRWGWKRSDAFVAFDILNATTAILLKKLRRTKLTVYVVTDFSTERTGSKWLNWFYRKLDAFCWKRADWVLNTTEQDKKARGQKTVRDHEYNLPSLCPHVYPKAFLPRSGDPVLVYLGALEPRFGVDVAIRAFALVHEEIPYASLHIIGSGSQRKELEDVASSLGLSEWVCFHGFLPDDAASYVLSLANVGLAPYIVNPALGMLHDLDSAKIRYYASEGLPTVVSTDTPQCVSLVARFGAGVSAEPTPEAFAKATMRLLSDSELWTDRQRGARKLVEYYDAENYLEGFFAALFGEPHSVHYEATPERVSIFAK